MPRAFFVHMTPRAALIVPIATRSVQAMDVLAANVYSSTTARATRPGSTEDNTMAATRYQITDPGFIDYYVARSGIDCRDAVARFPAVYDAATVLSLARWLELAEAYGLTHSTQGYRYTAEEMLSHHRAAIIQRNNLASAWDCMRLGLRDYNQRCRETAAGLGPSEPPDPDRAEVNRIKYGADFGPDYKAPFALEPQRDGIRTPPPSPEPDPPPPPPEPEPPGDQLSLF